MAGHGGSRAGSGRPKGSTNGIAVEALRAAFDASLGMPFEQAYAMMGLKLFQDFQKDINVDSAVRFFNRAGDKMIQALPQKIETEDVTSLSKQEIDDRINNLLTRDILSKPNNDSVDKPSI